MSTARKPRAAKGRTQKAMAVRIDLDLLPYLESQPNKAMAINKAIRVAAQDWQRRQCIITWEDCEDNCLHCTHANPCTIDGGVWCTLHMEAHKMVQVYCPDFTPVEN